MDEHDLGSALREHDDLERGLRVDERSRLLARLQPHLDKPTDAGPLSEPAAIVDITPTPSSRNRRKPPIWMAAAAVFLVLAGLFFLAGPREFNGEVEVVAEVDEPTAAPTLSPAPVPTTSPTPVPTCPVAIDAFMVAIDAWDGIEAWASLIDDRRPDPDLPTLAAAAIDGWTALAPGDPLLIGLEIEVDEPPADVTESRADTISRRSTPLQTAFDRMRLASSDASSVLSPCAEAIEIVARELDLPPPGTDGG